LTGRGQRFYTGAQEATDVLRTMKSSRRSSRFTSRRRAGSAGSPAKKTRTRPRGAGPSHGATLDGTKTREISTDAIDWSGAIRSINVDHVERLAGAAQLPAIKVWEFQPGRYRGIDGYHRWRLAKDRGYKVVEVIGRQFPKGRDGEKAFDFECVQSNLQHGLPLTREERDRAIMRIWNRWGDRRTTVGAETLESLGKLFNLTKQRVHQILSAAKSPEAPPVDERPSGILEDLGTAASRTGKRAVPGGFSNFGRFSAATRRLSRVLEDTDLIRDLLRQRRPEILEELRQLRGLIDVLVGPPPG
jgi:hypothetical protein